jgi:hypothetical protein
VAFAAPNPQYVLIPLNEGNLSRLGDATYAVDPAATQVAFPRTDGDPTPITLIDLKQGGRRIVYLDNSNTEGAKFSGDGQRLYYVGFFRPDGFPQEGLGFMDLASQATTLIVPNIGSPFFSVDRTGAHAAYQIETDTSFQYGLYADGLGYRQITTSPDAIAFAGTDCLAQFGTRPFISANGSKVVFITASTLGIAPADPTVGCRIFSYDVATDLFTQLVALPSSLLSIDIPALSEDGRWMSFPLIEQEPSGASRGMPALVDLQNGILSLPWLTPAVLLPLTLP